jgi:hypothetical protein
LAFLAFFAFFAFLAIASSFELMDGNATRGMLGGGPTSQHPQLQSQQIRSPLPRSVTQASSRYPQMLCILTRFWRCDEPAPANPGSGDEPSCHPCTSSGLTARQGGDAFFIDRGWPAPHLHHFTTKVRNALVSGESPLSETAHALREIASDSHGWAVR